jgi:5'-nucleotidase
MNILLTNDDGINSDGILKLAEALRSGGKHKVSVVAPDVNRSGVSHALSIFHNAVKLSSLGDDTWSCTGYPADCIIAGLNGLLSETPDLILSGINNGENLGTDIIYSGTAAAARQGGLAGIPSIALSLAGNAPYNWDMAISWITGHLEELLSYWRENTYVNVNIPNSADGPIGIIPSWPAAKTYKDSLTIAPAGDGSRYCFLEAGEDTTFAESGSDCDVVSRNFVSISSVYNYPAVVRELCPGAPDYAAVGLRSGKRK